MLRRTLLFLTLNFVALTLGALFTSDGVSSEWYQQLSKAPWTPPGWVFGAAWTFIMCCFAVYMAYLVKAASAKKTVIALFAIQWVLNVIWNPIFFHYQAVGLGLIAISLLTLLVFYLFFKFQGELGFKRFFLGPYAVWLVIATSLNAFILIANDL
jgi:benzodiazapine receptor